MQVDPDLQPNFFGPEDSLIEILELSLNVWVIMERGDSPVADGDAYVVHVVGFDLLNVGPGNKGPVEHEEVGPVSNIFFPAKGELKNG